MRAEISAALQGAPFAGAAAQGRGGWWRYLLCYLLIVAIYAASGAILYVAVLTTAGPGLLDPDDFNQPLAVYLGQNLLAGFVFVMASLILLLPATLAAVSLLHRRPLRTLFTGKDRFDWRGFAASTAATLALLSLWLAATLLIFPDRVRVHMDWAAWLKFLPWVLALVPLQTLAEEALFRGYLLQTVCAATRRPWLRLLLPAAIFFALHMWNPEVEVGGLWAVADYALISLYLTVLAFRGNGIETAWGLHLGLNWFLSLLLTISPGTLATPGPFTISGEHYALGFAATAVLLPLHYLAVVRRR